MQHTEKTIIILLDDNNYGNIDSAHSFLYEFESSGIEIKTLISLET